MNWTEDKEKQLLYQWAFQNQDSFSFQERMPLAETYFCPFDNTFNACGYGFASIPEMEKLFDELWMDDPIFEDIKRVCAVAAFKRQPDSAQEKAKEQENEDSLKIPDFVYIF